MKSIKQTIVSLFGKSKDSADYETLIRTGLQLCQQGHHSEALPYLDRSLAIAPRNEVAWMTKGACLIDLKRYKEGILCLDEAINLNHGYATAWFNKGIALDEYGDTNGALACMNQAVKIEPGDAQGWYYVGIFEQKLGCNTDAVR